MARKLFCEYGPLFYAISLRKEYTRRWLGDALHRTPFAKKRSAPLPHLIKGARSRLIKQLEGVDMQAQAGKVHNLLLAIPTIHGLVIQPGESFSFWRCVGKPTTARGYRTGLTISSGKLGYDVGGGLCQLSNILHWLVLHTPLTITEHHHHTDALFPDVERRVPFGTGTSVFYNNVDYRFMNTTATPVQLLVWCDETDLVAELRAAEGFPYRYRVEERDHHFTHEGEAYYRNSKIYRRVWRRDTGEELPAQLLLLNHSHVLYDPAKIPPEQIRE